METVLTAPERSDLRRLEKVIEVGVETFVSVGEALKQIRDQKLYREKWKTFESYCSDRFDFKRSYAHRLIEAVEVKMLPMGNKIKNERQAREVAKAPPKQRNAVVKAAEKIAKETGKTMTAKAIAEAREQIVEGDVVKKPTKQEQVNSFRSVALQHYKAAMRAVDDMHHLKNDPGRLKKIAALNVEIQDLVSEGWK